MSADYSRESMYAETYSVRELYDRLRGLSNEELSHEAARGTDEYTRIIAGDLLSDRELA